MCDFDVSQETPLACSVFCAKIGQICYQHNHHDKTLLLLHRMLSEYIAASPGSSVSEAVQLLAGPPLVRMVHTKEGAQVACSVIAYGTAKDRKKAIKGIAGLPDTVLKMAQDEWGSVVLMCILDTVDDTALLKKQILPDILVSNADAVKCDDACQVRMHVYTLYICKDVPEGLQFDDSLDSLH